MPQVPQHLEVIPVPMLDQQYLAIINCSTHCVFLLDPDTLSLTTYYWYVVILLCLVYCRAIVHAGLSKRRGMWRWMCCAAIAKPTNSLDPAVYAHS